MSQGESTDQKEQKELGRGWILMISLFLEVVMAATVYFPLSLLAVVAGIIGGLTVFVVSFFLVAYCWWAPNNICFTFVKEGTVKVVVLGDKVVKVLIQWKGHTIDNNWNIIPEDQDHKERWHPFGGFRFFGVYPFHDIHIYEFEWISASETGEVRRHPKEWLDYVLLMDDVYWAKVEEAEDQDLVPLDVEILITAAVVNPYKAKFAVQNWLEALINRMVPAVRDKLTLAPYKNLTVQQKAIGRKIFTASRRIRQEFEERYGILLRALEIKKIDPASKDLRDLTLKEAVAKREKDVVFIEADAEERRLQKVYGQIEALGETGRFVRGCEALEKSTEQGTRWVIFPEILSGILGRQSQAPDQNP